MYRNVLPMCVSMWMPDAQWSQKMTSDSLEATLQMAVSHLVGT